uniref:Uncharacterized protein n=1 Tax=Tanacetum cinerariifolium TaxID=118510 RepID=A0A6L2JJU9_TANCI|nr:hypothetical protein [Tanacetum cinerariifolium]
MENEHELSYETLTRVYLGSYEHYMSVGAEVVPLEPGFEFDDQEWVEMGSFLFVRLEMRSRCFKASILRLITSLGKGDLEDSLYTTGDKLEHPRELFLRSLFNSAQAILLACSIPIGWAYAFHQDKASIFRVPVANVTLSSSAHLLCENTDSFPLFATGVSFDSRFLLGLLVFSMVAASASRAAAIPSEINYRIVA